MIAYTPLYPHGDIAEVFPDVFFVTGTSRPNFEGTQWQFSRNMTIVREGGELTLVNTVRLDDDGLAALEALGKVKHVVRIGAFHGIDDAFYIDRYGAPLWALPAMKHERDKETDRELKPGGPSPISDCTVFVYETANSPEGLLLLDREGGILISCDSLQNWAEVDRFFDKESGERMTQAGFIKPANVGPGWLGHCKPEASDFQRIKALPFRHLLSAHGAPLRDKAKEALSATFEALFGV